MRFPRYPQYKESGVAWLGEIPESWSFVPFRHVIEQIESGTSVNSTDKPAAEGEFGVLKTSCVYNGIFNAHENKTVVLEETSRVSCPLRKNTLIISRMNTPDLVGSAGFVNVEREGLFLPDRLWQISLSDADPSFAYYWTLTHLYRAQVQIACTGTSSSMQNLSQNQLRSFIFPFPPHEEQSSIAAFLEHETAKIDSLVAEQDKLIGLLKEKRQAVISHAVTKGLDPDVPMKDSGVEWLGKVPVHWGHPRKLNDLAAPEGHTFVNGPFGSDLLTSELTTEGVPVIYIRDIKESGYIRVSEWCVTRQKANDICFCNVVPDDILIAKVGDPPGLAVVYPENEREGIVTQDVIRIRVDRSFVHPFFLRYCMNSDYGKAIINNISVESTRTRVSLGEYKALRFVLPPLEEQVKISNYLFEITEKLNSLQLEAQRTIDLLKERRAALISAAVTGKIDVRTYHPELAEAI